MAYAAKTIAATATLIVSANTNRKGIIFVNNSAVTIFVGPDSSISATNALPILAGQSYTEDSGADKMWLGDWYGIVSADTANLRYWERVVGS